MVHINSRKAQQLHHYIYVSDTKLDMLFQQIPRKFRRETISELRVDFKLASLVLRSADDPRPSRMAKLQIVERYIDKHEAVGTIQEPGRKFFRGQMEMRHALLREYEFTGNRIVIRENPAGVLFHAMDDEESRCVVLGGSSYHLLGEDHSTPSRSYSTLPRILSMLIDPPYRAGLSSKWGELALHADKYVKHCPIQRLEFLATILAEGQTPGSEGGSSVHTILGSPLYVALA